MRRPAPGAGQRGQASVELALALPLVALVLLAVVQVGLVVRDQVLVIHAARSGARAAAVHHERSAPVEAARAAGPLNPGRMAVRSRGRSGAGSLVEVEVEYRSPTEVPLVGALVGDVTLRGSATMRVEGDDAAA